MVVNFKYKCLNLTSRIIHSQFCNRPDLRVNSNDAG